MRGKNEGSIYEVPGVGWKAAISLDDVNGKPRRKVIQRKTRAEVADELNKLLHKKSAGRPISTARRTVAQFMKEWLTVHVGPNNAESYRSYEQVSRLYIVPSLGRLQLDRLTGKEVQCCLNKATQDGLGPTTVKVINATLKTALSTAQRWQYVDRNAAKEARPPKQVKYKAKFLTADQADKLLAHFAGYRYEALFYLALMMGLRRGELCGLHWTDFDLTKGQLHVQQAAKRRKGKGMVLAPVKTEGSNAIVPIPRLCVEALLRRQIIQEQERLKAGAKWKQDLDLVFTSRNGSMLAIEKPIRDLKKALACLRLPEIRLHDLRHSTASFLLAKGLGMKVVQEIMRHKNFQITMDLYSHLLPSALTDAARAMDDTFSLHLLHPSATPGPKQVIQ